jgi:hypothetical protein
MGERGGRRTWMLVTGAVVLVAFLVVAVALWLGADQRRSDNVAGFARAPVGCDTTLDFDATGTFVLYVETSGELDTLAGECDAAERYERDPDDVPSPELVLVDPSGDPLELTDADEATYDVDGYVGTAFRSVDITEPGDHVLTVAPTGGDPFAVAVGRAPDDGVALLRGGAIAAAIVGLVIGGLLLVLGSRRSPLPPQPSAPWSPSETAWPSSPPGFPAPPPTTGATGPPGAPSESFVPPAAPSVPPRTGAGDSPWGPPSPTA